MLNTFLPQVHVLKDLNHAFKDLQRIANNLPNSFTDCEGVTRFYNPPKIRLKEWRYQQKPLKSPFITTGGKVWQ